MNVPFARVLPCELRRAKTTFAACEMGLYVYGSHATQAGRTRSSFAPEPSYRYSPQISYRESAPKVNVFQECTLGFPRGRVERL